MKVLVIIIGYELKNEHCPNIQILNDYLVNLTDVSVDYAGVLSVDDFHKVENIISFKYKMISPKFQLSKMCNFISEYKEELNYDWYIKIRPDMKLLEPFHFEAFSDSAINARARNYTGPKKIKYGLSVNGEGTSWGHIDCCFYNENELYVELDDNIYIFHDNIVKKGAFDNDNYVDSLHYNHEGTHKYLYDSRNIPTNVIGINTVCITHNVFSGDINM